MIKRQVSAGAPVRTLLRDVRVLESRLHGVKPTYFVLGPSAASFRVQLFQDGVNSGSG